MIENDQFTNEPIEPDTLPDINDILYKELSPQYAKNNRILSLAVSIGLASILFLLGFQPFVNLPEDISNNLLSIIIVVVVIGAIHFTYHVLADPLKAYSLREKDITYRSGLIFRKVVTQPLRRVQHVEVEKGPIERMTGLATLQVFSAGGSSFTFAIPGLPEENAMQIRQYILDNKNSSENSEQSTKSDHASVTD
ncbi:PH domain-containing protein [Alteromonadaceae bacterium M269]|nr:PH domain-containing protein [Alteromonadaceae bacterium M269]